MANQQVEIKRGIGFKMIIDTAIYPALATGATWKASLVDPSTGMRYNATVTANGTIHTFSWSSGLVDDTESADYGKIDENTKDGTAHMSVGTYDFELYTSDHTAMGTLYGRFRVVDSNLMSKNAPAGE